MDLIQRRRRLRRRSDRNNESYYSNMTALAPSLPPIGSISDSSKIGLINNTSNWPEIVSTALTPETPKIGARLRLEATINGNPQCIIWLKVSGTQ